MVENVLQNDDEFSQLARAADESDLKYDDWNSRSDGECIENCDIEEYFLKMNTSDDWHQADADDEDEGPDVYLDPPMRIQPKMLDSLPQIDWTILWLVNTKGFISEILMRYLDESSLNQANYDQVLLHLPCFDSYTKIQDLKLEVKRLLLPHACISRLSFT